MPQITRKTTVTDGDTISASMWSTELDQIIGSGLVPTGIDSHSTDAAAMNVQTDPGTQATPSLAGTLGGELERLRYQINQMQGTTYWYQDPSTSIIGGGAWIDGDAIDITYVPDNYTPSTDGTSGAALDAADLTAHLGGINAALGSAYNVGQMEDGSVMLPFVHRTSTTGTPTVLGAGSTYNALYTTPVGRIYIPDNAETLSGTFRIGTCGGDAAGAYVRFILDSTVIKSSTGIATTTTHAWTEAVLTGCSTITAGWYDLKIELGSCAAADETSLYGYSFMWKNTT